MPLRAVRPEAVVVPGRLLAAALGAEPQPAAGVALALAKRIVRGPAGVAARHQPAHVRLLLAAVQTAPLGGVAALPGAAHGRTAAQ